MKKIKQETKHPNDVPVIFCMTIWEISKKKFQSTNGGI